jgi:TonB-linked SusC/RagA family outer membrane protein
MSSVIRATTAAAFACALASTALAQGTGRITGRVTDRESGQPIDAAQVRIDGTTIGAISNTDGNYAIQRIAPGTYQLRLVRLGYQSVLQSVTLRAGAPATANFALTRAPYQLESVVTTATGQQLTRELGHAIAKLDAPKMVMEQPITNFQDLLNGRTAGVTLLASNGTVGGGSRVRIRGLSSASLSNDPLIIVDGVRMEQSSPALGGTLYIGGGRPNFMNNLNPEEIENIEIVKGPSAATLYGTQAANGVIVITTKRGRTGPPKWNVYAEGGITKDPAEYPGIYYTAGRSPTGAARNCLQWQAILNQCTITQVHTRNLLEDAETSPIGTGQRQQYGTQVSGGNESIRYFVSGDWENENGLLRMPDAERDSLFRERGVTSIPRRQEIPNQLTKTSLRSNLGLTLSQTAELNLSSGYVYSYNLLPQTGDNLQGVVGSAMYGVPNPAVASHWGFAPPRDGFSKSVSRVTNQFMNSSTMLYRPQDWLNTRATIGLDWMQFNDQADVANGQGCRICGVERTGVRTINKWNNLKYTVDLNAAATFNLTSQIVSKTAVGAQWNRDGRYGTLNTAQTLPPGGSTIDAGADKTSGEQTIETVSYGTYIEQQLGWREKLYVTAAVRRDQNSAFGGDFGAINYPKFAVSYVALESNDATWLNQIRLRGALGESGQQPGAAAAITYLTPTTSTVFGLGDVPSVTFGALGNTNIKPERSREIEAGFDVTTLRNRVSVVVTYYDKKTTDALINRPLPGSLGAGAARVENVGVVTNKGIEVSVNARVIDRDDIRYDLGLEASGNKNRLEELAPGIPPLTGFGFQNRPGYPLFGLWWPKLTGFSDANNNGTIEPSEVTVTDTAVFNGSTVPTKTLTASNTIGLFKDRLRLAALVDYRGGYISHNVNNLFQCAFVQNCAALHVKGFDLKEQAKAVAGPRAFAAYAEKADFVKLREISATYTLPTSWLSRVRASSATIVLTARNLATWTDFNSWDPENNTSGSDGPNYNFVQLAQPRVYLVRLNFGF